MTITINRTIRSAEEAQGLAESLADLAGSHDFDNDEVTL